MPEEVYDHLFICDVDGRPHSLRYEEEGGILSIDGRLASIVSLTREQVSFSHDAGTYTCSTEAWWYAFNGGAEIAPTAQETGMYLAQSVVLWEKLTCMRELIRHALQKAAESLERHTFELLLPQPHLDPYVVRVLERYDGSKASAQSIVGELLARVGGKIAALSQLPENEGKPPAATGSEARDATLEKEGPDENGLAGERPGPSFAPVPPGEVEGRAKFFYWNDKLDNLLMKDYLDNKLSAPEIAVLRGWPVTSIRSRVYYKGLHRLRHSSPREQETEEDGKQLRASA